MAIHRNIGNYDPETLETTTQRVVEHVGRVLEVYRDDYRAMSDVYTLATFASVVNDDGSLAKVLVNANFECDQSGNHAEVDATDEAKALHAAWLQKRAEAEAELERQRRAERELRAKLETKGTRVKVVRGKEKGHEGTVAFVKPGEKVLVKPDAVWQDRQANGVWVKVEYLTLRS